MQTTSSNEIVELSDCRPESVAERVVSETAPILLKGLVREWPAVIAGQASPRAAAEYIRNFYSGDPVTAFRGSPSIEGKVGYIADLSDFNFERLTARLDDVLEPILENLGKPDCETHYVGSTLLDRWFPGFREENDIGLNSLNPLASIWLGNRTRVSAHFDAADNVACCTAGRRRFTLFPPEQLENLYIGPWDKTPAGQAISLVDFRYPDFERFPRFRKALDAAIEVTLQPGDALFLPSMWWHHVEGLDDFNVLVNYWWRTTPGYMGAPLSVLKHALLGLRDLPPEQRAAWKNIFDYYVFDPSDAAVGHIPESARGILAPMSDATARQLRAELLNQLNR